MTVTETMVVTIITKSATRISFRITNPISPLFLGTLDVDNFPAGANGVIGTLSPVGVDAQNPSVHGFHLGNARFQTFLASVNANLGPPLSIQITYDNGTLAATDVRVPPVQQVAAHP